MSKRNDLNLAITQLEDYGLQVVESFTGIPVSTQPFDELVIPMLDPKMAHQGAKVRDMRKFDAEDGGAPKASLLLQAVIVYPGGQDDSPSIKRHARTGGWRTASLRELVSWFKHTGFTGARVVALGPNPDDKKRQYSYDASCGNAAPMFNYATPGKLDVCVDPVWVDWPSWANFLLVRDEPA